MSYLADLQWLDGRRRRWLVRFAVVVLALAMLPLSGVATGRANAAPASGDPQGVQTTLEGCRASDEALTGTLPLICPDAAYTTGNLGAGWNELDLVPHRLTVQAGNSAPSNQTYTLAVVADGENAGHPGYDVITPPTINTTLSDATCPIVVGDQQTQTPGIGGTGSSIYRMITITQAQNTTCVFDYDERLAVGSHLYPGSSLHSNLTNQHLGTAGIGARDVSIPVKEIAPQSIDKTVDASRGADAVWSVSKSATPANLHFGDTCATGASFSQGVNVTVTWTKTVAPSGDVTVVTNLFATNPSHRVITVDVSDVVSYDGGTYTIDTGQVGVPALTSGYLVGTDSRTISTTGSTIDDTATATYTDSLTGVAVPGTTTVSKTTAVQSSGTVSNSTATITDSESISGAGLSFSVADPSTGSFTGGYVADTATTGPVGWSSGTVSDSGSVTFHKTVYLDGPRITSGDLTDTASLSGSGGQTATSNTVDVGIDSTATVSLTVDKTRSPVTTEDQTFTFNVLDSGNQVVGTPSVTIPGGAGTSAVYSSSAVTGLAPGTYTVNEPAQGVYGAQTATATITLPACSGSVSFNNVAAPAHARVQKITSPTSSTSWQFTLSGPDVGSSGTETVTATAGAGYANFTSALNTDGATYTITETPQTGWDLTSIAGDFAGTASRVTTSTSAKTCSFVLNMPADSNGVLSCSFTNTQRGSITIVKDAQPDSSQSFGYTATGEGLSGFSLVDDGITAGANTQTFTNLRPSADAGNYVVSENLPVTGWDFTNLSCASTNGSSTVTKSGAQATIALGAGDSVTCTYTNVRRGHVTVVKTQNGATPTNAYTFELTGGPDSVDVTRTTDSTNQGTLDFGLLKPGAYTLCELAVPAGTHSTLQDAPYNGTLDPNSGNVCYSFTLTAGQTLTVNVDNQLPQGNALTIGYWRNWNSCSGTGNDRVAMAARTGNHLMDEFLPVTLATGAYPFTVTTCQQGLSVLSTPSSKYAEHQLAAQLLAAELNVKAGAAHSSTTDATIAHAQALLGSINWEGSATSRIIDQRDPRRQDFLDTANYLNSYNNDLVT